MLKTVKRVCELPTELLIRFPYSAQVGMTVFVALFRYFYRQGKRDIYISWMFEDSRYGISIMYGAMTAFAELQAAYRAFRQVKPSLRPKKKDDDVADRTQRVLTFVSEHAVPAMIRAAFAIGRCAVVTAAFEYHTVSAAKQAGMSDEQRDQALTQGQVHGKCVQVLAAGAAMQWFSVQMQGYDWATPRGALAGGMSFALPISLFVLFTKYSNAVYYREHPLPGTTPGPKPTGAECLTSCIIETLSLAVSIPRPAGFV